MLLKHVRDILILPFTVTCVIPFFLYDANDNISGSRYVQAFGLPFLIAGLALFWNTVSLFHSIGKGTLAPWSAKKHLVVAGPYRYCRNPMITGVLFILIGEGLITNSRSILVWVAAVFVINTIYFILIEEPGLVLSFGKEYENYRRNVPRWLPRLRPYINRHPSNPLPPPPPHESREKT